MSQTGSKNKGLWRWARWVILAVVACLVLLKLFYIDLYTVPQAGMFPTIKAGGRFLGWKRPYRDASQVRRGDVIVFARRLPDNQTYQFVWRVIGLPGDQISLSADAVIVNGQPLRHELLPTDANLAIFREHNGNASYDVAYPIATSGSSSLNQTLTVPAGEFFVLGDNRASAADSRYAGNVAFREIIAKRF